MWAWLRTIKIIVVKDTGPQIYCVFLLSYPLHSFDFSSFPFTGASRTWNSKYENQRPWNLWSMENTTYVHTFIDKNACLVLLLLLVVALVVVLVEGNPLGNDGQCGCSSWQFRLKSSVCIKAIRKFIKVALCWIALRFPNPAALFSGAVRHHLTMLHNWG